MMVDHETIDQSLCSLKIFAESSKMEEWAIERNGIFSV
jgi:hypothetical protein